MRRGELSLRRKGAGRLRGGRLRRGRWIWRDSKGVDGGWRWLGGFEREGCLCT